MVRLVTVVPALLVMLSGCNSGSTVTAENATPAEVAEATRNAVKLEPGKWETTVALLSLDGPGLPPGLSDQMKQQMQAQKVETCLTAEQAEKPPQDMFGAAGNCTYEKFAMGGGTMSGVLVCKSAPGMPGSEIRATMAGSFGSTSYDVTSDAVTNMPSMPGAAAGGKMTTKTRVSGKRIGDCAEPKAS